MNTGYKQAVIAYYVSYPSNEPLDIDGNLTRLSGKKQAILLLEGFSNPDTNRYEIASYFKAGDEINGEPTRIYNPNDCPVTVEGFISLTPDNVELDVDTSNVQIVVSSSHAWSIVSAIPPTISFNIISGNKGSTTITLSLIDNTVENTFALVFRNNNGDEANLTITLGQEVPNNYPDVWREKIIEEVYEDVCRIGEQVYTRRNLDYKPDDVIAAGIDQERLNNWKSTYSWADIETTPEIYNSIYNSSFFSGYWVTAIINKINEVQSNDIYKHLIPSKNDILELLGYVLCYAWDGKEHVDDTLAAQTTGQLAIKKVLGTASGDDKRFTYPSQWADSQILLNGSDKFGLAIAGSGMFHRTNAGAAGITGSLFLSDHFLLRELTNDVNNNEVNVWVYRNTDNKEHVSDMEPGLVFRKESTGFLAKPIRTLRYIKHDYEVYTNGVDIQKISTGQTIPDGYNVIPKGSLRGAYFAHPEYTLTQLKKIETYIQSIINLQKYIIG